MMVNFLATIAPLVSIDKENPSIPYKLPIRGVAVDTSVNKNNWRVSEKLLAKVADDLKRKSLRINHGASVTDVIGKITDAEIMDNTKVVFSGEIIGSDPITTAVKEKIINGLLDSVSIGMDGFSVVCSVCGKQTRDGKKVIHNPERHDPPGHEVIMDGEVKELSVVLDPAYSETKINVAASFISALESYIMVTPQDEGVTNEVGDGSESRPTDGKKAEGDNMAAVIPTAEPSGGKAPSMDDIMRVIQDAFGKADARLAEIEARLKALEEAEEARRRAEEEARKKAEEAEEAKKGKDKDEDEDVEEAEEAFESKLSKSVTVVGSAAGKADWVAELEEAIRRAQTYR